MIGECPFMQGMTRKTQAHRNYDESNKTSSKSNDNVANNNNNNNLDITTATTAPVVKLSTQKESNESGNVNNAIPHYSSYLGSDVLLNLQSGPSRLKPKGKGLMHHEEMTFIIVHQTIELWFRLTIHDLRDVRNHMQQIDINDTTKSFQHYARSIRLIRRSQQSIRRAIGSINLLETMQAAEFIEFRDFLTPASGLQSVQFRSLEHLLGLPNTTRALINNADVYHYLNIEEVEELKAEAEEPSLNTVLMRKLSQLRVPEQFIDHYLGTAKKLIKEQYERLYNNDSQAEANKTAMENMVQRRYEELKKIFDDPLGWTAGENAEQHTLAYDFNNVNKTFVSGQISNNVHQDKQEKSQEYVKEQFRKCVIAALFVISYREHNEYTPIAELLDELISLEEVMILFRTRHCHMVERMIGSRGGTGGTSSGLGYLNLTLQYRIFTAIWLVRRMFIRASALPALSKL